MYEATIFWIGMWAWEGRRQGILEGRQRTWRTLDFGREGEGSLSCGVQNIHKGKLVLWDWWRVWIGCVSGGTGPGIRWCSLSFTATGATHRPHPRSRTPKYKTKWSTMPSKGQWWEWMEMLPCLQMPSDGNKSGGRRPLAMCPTKQATLLLALMALRLRFLII